MAVLKNLVNIGDACISGDLEANKIVKRGGTSSQFLKADGSTDSTTYSTTNHTHTTSIATSTGTSQITLAHGGKYSLTAGGNSYIFTMPSDNNTTYYLSLNGTTTGTIGGGTSLGTIYAPINIGSSGQILKSTGAGAPVWTSSLTSFTITNLTAQNILCNSDLGGNIGDDSGHAFNEIHAYRLHLAKDEDSHGSYDGGKISFGDGDFVYIGESSDDDLVIHVTGLLRLDSEEDSIICNTNNSVRPSSNNMTNLGENTFRWKAVYSNYSYASSGFFQTSDIRKKNIKEEISLDKAYDLIDKCQTIIYTLKDDKSNKEQIGLIAQEVQEFFPEIISEDENGMLSLDYAKLTVVILKVLKDLISRLKTLENK